MQNLLMIPGLGSDYAVWAHTIAVLGAGASCLVGDTLHDTSLQAMARRILAQAPQTFCLAGVSMGGMVALEIMRIAPERVTGLALVDTNALPDTQEQAARRRAVNEAIRSGSGAMGASSLDYLVHPTAGESVRRELTEMGSRVGAETYVRQNEAVLAREDLWPVLATIAVPFIVVVGEQDRMTPPALAAAIHKAVKGSDLHVIPDCGHLPPIEKPEVMADLLRELLGRTAVPPQH